MTLAAGSRLGPYEITGKLGEGGMGEVYRATDTKLRREVAIKVLPAAFTEDKERLARFEREAQLLAQLQHPNIASIYGLEESAGTRALVMELVEGPTLAERLEHGPLPLNESLSVSLQIALALEAAHEKGIVHRDLKPQNVKASIEGRVKVLDFGLAKAMDPLGGAPATASQLAHSPTLTLGATVEGMILGTAAYMAPEQAKGRPVDKRADIWAFGVVLFEMLTGERLFAAGSVTEMLSAVLTREVEWSRLPAGTPPAVVRLLHRCLVRDPKDRLHDIADARIVLSELERGSMFEPVARPESTRFISRRSFLAAAVVALVALAVGVAIGRLVAPAQSAPIVWTQLTRRHGVITAARFTPDGKSIVYSAAWDGEPIDVYVERIGSSDGRSLGLAGAALLSVSKNGELAVSLGWKQTLGRETVGTLATVPLDGGAPRPLLENVLSADWSPDGKELAVAYIAGNECRLEYPVGTLLRKTTGWMSDLRVNADGKRVAFLDHPNRGDSTSAAAVVDRQGTFRVLSEPAPRAGLAWSPDGREIWLAPTDYGAVEAVGERTAPRTVLTLPGTTRVDDAARDGRFLTIKFNATRDLRGRALGSAEERRLGLFDWAFPRAISADGGKVLFEEQQIEGNGYAIYLRGTDGSPAVRIGEGTAYALSSDARWMVIIRDPFSEHPKLVLTPTGTGQPRELADNGVRYQSWGALLPDGRSLIGFGELPGKPLQLLVRNLEGAPSLRAITPNGVRLTMFGVVLSPDGERVAVPEPDGHVRIRLVRGEGATDVPATGPEDEPVGWSPDGRALYVARPTVLPLRIDQVDLATGTRSLFTTLTPADPAGVSRLGPVFFSQDGRFVAYSFIRTTSDLYLVTGAR